MLTALEVRAWLNRAGPQEHPIMHTAFRASVPIYTFPATPAGYAVWHQSRPGRPQCQWVIDPASRKPVAQWIAGDEYFISCK